MKIKQAFACNVATLTIEQNKSGVTIIIIYFYLLQIIIIIIIIILITYLKWTGVTSAIRTFRNLSTCSSNIYATITRTSQFSCPRMQKRFYDVSKFVRHLNTHQESNGSQASSTPASASSQSNGQSSGEISGQFNDQSSGRSSCTDELFTENTSFDSRCKLPQVSSMMKVMLQLHNKDNFARSDVLFVQQLIVEFGNEQLQRFRTFAETLIRDSNDKLNVVSFVAGEQQSFSQCNTEFLLLKQLKELQLCDNSDNTVEIDRKTVIQHKRGVPTIVDKRVTISVMPLEFQFTTFFECNDHLLRSLNIMEAFYNLPYPSRSDSFTNFCQGPLWQAKAKKFRSEGKIVLPYFLYADETEMNNGLGPHASPSFQVYYSFPFLRQSPLFTAGIIQKDVYQKYGNTRCLILILKVLKNLELDGIEILTSEVAKKVHFVLGLVLGDNAGINKMLGFKACSHTCGCRFCKMPQQELKVASKLYNALLRTKALTRQIQ